MSGLTGRSFVCSGNFPEQTDNLWRYSTFSIPVFAGECFTMQSQYANFFLSIKLSFKMACKEGENAAGLLQQKLIDVYSREENAY